MSSAAAPHIPPRPGRPPHAAGAGAPSLPEVPPRPSSKDVDRSNTPNTYPYSPLFDPPPGQSLGRSIPNDVSDLSLPRRPPSVTLPSIGQEGSEYADVDFKTTDLTNSTDSERAGPPGNVGDLKLHAPKPSLPKSSAKAQVKAVTRTNDQQAAAHGFGQATAPGNEEPGFGGPSSTPQAPSIVGSVSQPSPPTSRRQSVAPAEDEQASTEMGLRVPINPNAGEVQAPSPSPFPPVADHHAPGKKRHHMRTPSGREVLLPPGSYGLHGHGVQTHGRFDKDWYAKHPDQLVHEETIGHGHYTSIGSGRGDWAMSSDDLNKIVRETASRGAGFGTNEGLMSYPDEQIGFIASDHYSSRVMTPSQGGGLLQTLQSNSSQPTIESPLRQSNFPADIRGNDESPRPKASISGESEAADGETEEDVIHVDDPTHRYGKVTGGRETIHESEDLGPQGGNTADQGGYLAENGYGVPILASDEVAKSVGGEFMQPAISPKPERRDGNYHVGEDDGSAQLTPLSRPTSRPGSLYGSNPSPSRFPSRLEDREDMHTPLEDVEEYEPLFPDDDESKERPLNPADRFKKRPDMMRHRFPSQDIWEDTPTSAMHVTTVSNTDAAAQGESGAAKPAPQTFEDPRTESARKGEVDEAERAKLIPKGERLAKSSFAPHLRDDMAARPGMQQRFPSRDIWEDTPDSTRLVTTVSTPPATGTEPTSPDEKRVTKPAIPSRPINRSKLGESAMAPNVPVAGGSREPVAPGPSAVLSQPAEKTISPTEGRQGPSVPDRPKPQIPARPAKKESCEALTKIVSGSLTGKHDAVTSPPPPKAKPTIPAKPGGNKANLPTSFMSDLNQRLQLGPRAPAKEKAPPEAAAEKENVPLSDARKARTRGPQRRAPAKSPSSSAETAPASLPKSSISATSFLWYIDEEGSLTAGGLAGGSSQRQDTVPEIRTEDTDSKASLAATRGPTIPPGPLAATGLAKNIAGESADPSPAYSEIPTPGTERDDPGSRTEGNSRFSKVTSPLREPLTASDDQVSDGVLAADAGAEPTSMRDLPADDQDDGKGEARGENEGPALAGATEQ